MQKRLFFSIVFAALLASAQAFGAQGLNPSAKAKAVILLYLDGGPAQTDMFDPKPEQGRNYAGKYLQDIPTKTPGLRFGPKLPLLANMSDKFSIIRSMTHHSGAHEIGHYYMLTGDMQVASIVYPSYGTVVAYMSEPGYKNILPPYISVTEASNRFNEAGFLSPIYKSFDTGGDPTRTPFTVEGIVNKGMTDQQLARRRVLLAGIDSLSANVDVSAPIQKLNQYRAQNYKLILGDARSIFDLTKEPKELRKAYGSGKFGQSCLLARRLVQNGVKIVNVRFTGWDTHKEHFARMDERLAEVDQAVSALLTDLDAKGMLDSTIIVMGGEFGRTPKVWYDPPWNGGRAHFGEAFAYMVAGGGFKGGRVLGKTDEKGEKVIERPVYPSDLIASIYALMGIDPKGVLPHPVYGNIPILPSFNKPNQSAGILTELF